MCFHVLRQSCWLVSKAIRVGPCTGGVSVCRLELRRERRNRCVNRDYMCVESVEIRVS